MDLRLFLAEKYSREIDVKLTSACVRCALDFPDNSWNIEIRSSFTFLHPAGGTKFAKFWEGIGLHS